MGEGEDSDIKSEEGSQDDLEEGEDGDMMEFKLKEFFVQPYKSETLEASQNEVSDLTVKNSRPLIKMRLTKKRREFNNENRNLMDKDGGESIQEIKPKS